MKTRLKVLKLSVILCSAFATAAAFGQSTYVWTNQNPALLSSGDLNRGANWTNVPPHGLNFDPGGVPRPDFTDGVTWGDTMLFDGITTGPVLATQSGGFQVNGGGSGQPYGIHIHLSSNQTSPVTIISPVSTSGGMRMNDFVIDAGSGGFRLGNSNAVNVLDIVAGVLNGQIFGFTNNSATPSYVNADVRWRMGGAGFHPHIFTGTGDWIVNNHMRSSASSALGVVKDGPGTMIWSGTNVGPQSINWFDPIGSPIRVNAGTLIIKTSDLVDTSAGGPAIVHNGVLLLYDVQPIPGYVTGPSTNPGTMSGTGPFQVNAGTLTLSGANTFTGNITLSGGTLIAGSTEAVGVSGPLGQGGTISFSGGTLQFSANNVFDYSSRFSTAAGQAISIATAGQDVTFVTGLGSSGGTLTKTNSGTLTLVGTSSYSGLTTINGGKLVFQGSRTGSGSITLANSATLGVFDTGTQVTPNALTLGNTSGCALEFNNVNSTTTAPISVGTLSSFGTIIVTINSGAFTAGHSYPLLQWTSGSTPAVSLGIVSGADGTLSTNGNKIQFNVASVAPVWTGTVSGNWSDPNNWTTPYSDPKPVLFDDTAPGTTNVIVDVQVQPGSVTINNATKNYSITSSGANNVAGSTGLSKNGNGTLTLSGGANTYTGVTTLKGGTVSVAALANGGVASDIGAASSSAANLVFDGGTLRYTGGGTNIDRLFTVGFNGGTIDSSGSGGLTLNNPDTVTLIGTLTLTGGTATTNVLASALFNSGGVIKSGAGMWILTGTNSHGGGTVVANGVLQVGANGGTGSLGIGNVSVGTGTALDFRRTGTLTVPGAISGNGSVTNDGSGTVVLVNNNSYTGGTIINAGTLQLGAGNFGGSATGSLYGNGPIVNNSLLVFNTSSSFTYSGNGVISGPGNVIVQGGGFIKAIGNNTYTGWTQIDPVTTFQPREGQDGFLASPLITNNGTLRIVSQDTSFTYSGPIRGSGKVQIGASSPNVGVVTLTGTNTYNGGTQIGGNTLVLGDGFTAGSGAIAGNVQFVNNFTIAQDNPRTIIFNRPDDFTFGGTITTNFTSPQSNRGIVQQNGTGRLTLASNNSYGSGTIINSGILQVGTGGGFGSLGTGNVTDQSQLVFNRTGILAVGTVTGTGSISNLGSGTVTLRGTSSIGGNLDLQAGTFGAAAAGSIGSVSVGADMNIASGVTVLAGLNRSLTPSNSTYTVAGVINHTNGGILKLMNGGPLLQVGDKFTIFSQPVTNLSIVSPGFTVQNDLAVDGSVTVTAVLPPPTITATVVSGTNLVLSWPAAWIGAVHVQAQTNSRAVGLSNNWVTISGTDASNGYTNTIAKVDGTVFFRLISP